MRILAFFLLAYCGHLQAVSWDQLKDQTISQDLPLIPGMCTKEKAERLMDFIYAVRPKVCVEIGSLAGSTTYPMARALQFLGEGLLYAVDAWDFNTNFEGHENDISYVGWMGNLRYDMNSCFQYLNYLIEVKGLKGHCYPLRMRSDEAVMFFSDETIDLLYLDGADSEQGSLQDAMLYLPKVKKGGYIWLNFTQHPYKYPTIAYLMKHCEWQRKESLSIHCILLKKL